MSDRLSNSNTVTNDDVIDELTKDLGNSLKTREVAKKLDEFTINPGSSSDSLPSNNQNAPFTDIPLSTDTDIDKDEPELATEDKDDESDSDSIDEVALKDAEVELTDDQKEERKIIADELKVAGNEAFQVGDYNRSIEKYTEALKICPLKYPQQRSILFCNRSASKMKLEKYKKAIRDCDQAIELDDKYVKAYTRRAVNYEATEKYDEALADFKKILELEPSNQIAKSAVSRLPPLIEERNEKLKTEMLGKLKDLGNMILKPFGLSTENFKLEQDDESKGYKINFKQ